MTQHLNATILLVDDHPANLRLLIDTLLREGYQVMVAENGESALVRVRHRQPDLILLDVRMPGIDGFETCRRLKADPTANMPIIFLSAQTDTVDKLEGFAAGGVDYITKPIDIVEVLARIETHLTLCSLRQALYSANEQLEERVARRTVELSAEIEKHAQSKREREALLTVVQSQNEQLRATIQQLHGGNPEQNTLLANTTHQQFATLVAQMEDQLTSLESELADTPLTTTLSPQVDKTLKLLDQMWRLLTHFTDALAATQQSPPVFSPARLAMLSNRERELLRLIGQGLTTAAIADTLSVTESTVRTYRHRIAKKLELEDTTHLVHIAVQDWNMTNTY